MSNFFGALDSDDDEPKQIVSSGTAAAAKSKDSADRQTGAAKKNKDQKRHGATRGGDKAPAAGDKKAGGKREFERRSGTGRAPGQSKDGRGKFGFGSAEQDAEDVAKRGVSALDGDADADAEDAVEESAPEPDNTMSLDDFMAQRTASKLTLANIAGAKKVRAVKAEGEVVGKAEVGVLMEASVKAKEANGKGLSKRLASANVVQVKYGFKSENAFEDRPPREDRPRRDGPREDRPRRDGPREDRPRREPRADGEKPARREPRADGDKPRRDGKKPESRDSKPRQERPQRAGGAVNLRDTNAFPSL